MPTKPPHEWPVGQVTVYNDDTPQGGHWQCLDIEAAYLASCRHLQIPVNLGPALVPSWSSDAIGGQMVVTLRVPAYTTSIRTGVLATVDTNPDDTNFVQFQAYDAAAWGSLNKLTIPHEGDTVDTALWVESGAQMADDAAPAGTNCDLPIAKSATEKEIKIRILINGGDTRIWAVRLQSQVDDDATL